VADKDSVKPRGRMVKKANQTVREKAESSQKQTSKPKKQGVLRLTGRFIATPFKFIGRSIGKLGKYKAFRVIGRILWPTYFRNSFKELKQVTWPGRRESWQLTSAVIIFSIIFGLLIAIVDFGLDKIFKQVLLK
jgi:preprotein translocase SecE subunit